MHREGATSENETHRVESTLLSTVERWTILSLVAYTSDHISSLIATIGLLVCSSACVLDWYNPARHFMFHAARREIDSWLHLACAFSSLRFQIMW